MHSYAAMFKNISVDTDTVVAASYGLHEQHMLLQMNLLELQRLLAQQL